MGRVWVNWQAGTQKRFERTMKTQLLQDLNESGSANARPPSADAGKVEKPAAAAAAAAPAGPAVWHSPQRDRAGASAWPAEPTAPTVPLPKPHPQAQAQPNQAHAEGAGLAAVQPKGFAPQPLPFGAPLPGREPPRTAGDPDWLTERLAREAAVHERPEWGLSWTRRLLSWGAAGVLLALVAAGGLWLYEQSRVEGALVVVANTNPVPASAPRAALPRALPTAPAVPAVTTNSEQPAMPIAASADTASSKGVSAAGETSAAATVETPGVAAVDIATPVRSSPPKHKRSSIHKPAKTVASAAPRDAERSGERPYERSYRQRYEETLMQCRAHGYDERQCLQRGCEMTRYGFACKG